VTTKKTTTPTAATGNSNNNNNNNKCLAKFEISLKCPQIQVDLMQSSSCEDCEIGFMNLSALTKSRALQATWCTVTWRVQLFCSSNVTASALCLFSCSSCILHKHQPIHTHTQAQGSCT
jgi:hypothetical protein